MAATGRHPGVGNGDVVPAYLNDMGRWLADRSAGAAAPDPTTPTGAMGVMVTTCP